MPWQAAASVAKARVQIITIAQDSFSTTKTRLRYQVRATTLGDAQLRLVTVGHVSSAGNTPNPNALLKPSYFTLCQANFASALAAEYDTATYNMGLSLSQNATVEVAMAAGIYQLVQSESGLSCRSWMYGCDDDGDGDNVQLYYGVLTGVVLALCCLCSICCMYCVMRCCSSSEEQNESRASSPRPEQLYSERFDFTGRNGGQLRYSNQSQHQMPPPPMYEGPPLYVANSSDSSHAPPGCPPHHSNGIHIDSSAPPRENRRREIYAMQQVREGVPSDLSEPERPFPRRRTTEEDRNRRRTTDDLPFEADLAPESLERPDSFCFESELTSSQIDSGAIDVALQSQGTETGPYSSGMSV